MRYHSTMRRLALTGSASFPGAVARLAGAALAVASTPHDRQLCHDLRRLEGRYPFRSLQRLFDLAQKADAGAAEEFLADLRTVLHPREPAGNLAADLIAETAAQGVADVAQLEVLRDPNPVNVARARTTLSRHAASIRRFMDDLAGFMQNRPLSEG